MDRLIDILQRGGIKDAGIIKYSDCKIINPRLAEKMGFIPRTVCIGTIPYYTPFCNDVRTVSSYALAYDYHELIKIIGEKVTYEANKLFPEAKFRFFGDHSPINEKDAAAKAGLGIIGAHSLLITPDHSSFVFLVELFTDLEFAASAKEVEHCEMCGNCIKACPGFLSGKGECLSAVTQKKGTLSAEEEDMIKECGSVWGCDLCQTVCPHTKKAIESGTLYTDLEWFYEHVLPVPNQESIDDEFDFKNRAYSWRGKATIMRNIELLNK